MHKERKETTHVRGRWQKHTSTYKEDKYNVCQKWSQVTYWHDHVQALNPQTLFLLGFTVTQATLLVTLRFHSKVSDHHQ